jgi:hypothetical protein
MNPGGAITKLESRHTSQNETRDKYVRLVVLPGARHTSTVPICTPSSTTTSLPCDTLVEGSILCTDIDILLRENPVTLHAIEQGLKTSKISLSVKWVTTQARHRLSVEGPLVHVGTSDAPVTEGDSV